MEGLYHASSPPSALMWGHHAGSLALVPCQAATAFLVVNPEITEKALSTGVALVGGSVRVVPSGRDGALLYLDDRSSTTASASLPARLARRCRWLPSFGLP